MFYNAQVQVDIQWYFCAVDKWSPAPPGYEHSCSWTPLQIFYALNKISPGLPCLGGVRASTRARTEIPHYFWPLKFVRVSNRVSVDVFYKLKFLRIISTVMQVFSGCLSHGTVGYLIESLSYHMSNAMLILRIKEVCASGNMRDKVFFF